MLLALGLAYFFGLMSGLAGRDRAAAAEPTPVRAEQAAALPESMPAVETAVPTAVSRGPSHTDLAGGNTMGVPAAEPTIPPTLQTFEDGTSEEAAAPPAPVAGHAPAEAARPASHAPKTAPASAGGKFWVQVASLTSHEEAGALSGRLSKHGFHALILSAAGPRGGKVYRVRVGPYKSEEEAGRAATKLGNQEKLKGSWVVPEGK